MAGGEATWIAPRLWQGSKADCGTDFRAAEPSPNVLVLCAKELQLPDECFPGIRVVRVRLNDDGTPVTRAELRAAEATADEVARLYLRGARFLITCHMGLNRSGLVTALVLHRAYGLSGRQAIAAIRRARPAAVFNPYFEAYLNQLPARAPWSWSPDAFRSSPTLLARVQSFSAEQKAA